MDKDFNSIRDLLFGTKIDPSSSGSNAVPLGKRPIPDKSDNADPAPLALPSAASGEVAEEGDLDYDQVVRALAFDKRAKPTDRLKTEEELAAEEKDKLEKAERARLRRMNGEEGGSDEESGRRSQKRRRAEADDLEDDFVEEDELGALGRGLGDRASETGDQDDEDDGSDDEEEDGDGSGSESGSEDGEDVSEAEMDDSNDEEQVQGDIEELVTASRSKTKGKGKVASKELPYTFPCPSNHDEFLDIIEDIAPEDIPTVVQRIRVIYHASLAEDNKLKLQASCISHSYHHRILTSL